jgi:multiple sugar transport system permease protein
VAKVSARRRRVSAGIGKLVATGLILIWSLGPILFMVRASLTPEREIFAARQRLFQPITLENYHLLATQWGEFFSGLANSAIIAAGATLLAVAISTLAGYGYSRWHSNRLSISVFWLVAVRLMPPIVLTLPLFPIINWLHLNDTHLVLILLYATFIVSLGALVMRTVIDHIPRELDEAALTDGASRLQILYRVVLPLATHGMIAVAIFVIVYAWNEFLFAFLFTSAAARTAPLALSEMLNSLNGTEWGEVFAATTLQLLPVLILVVLGRRYLIEGVTAGAVKG